MTTALPALVLALAACWDEPTVELSPAMVEQAIADVEAHQRFAAARDAGAATPLPELVTPETVASVRAAAAADGLTAAEPSPRAGTWTGQLRGDDWTTTTTTERVVVAPDLVLFRTVLEVSRDDQPGLLLAVVQQRGAELWGDDRMCRWFGSHTSGARDPALEWPLFQAFGSETVNQSPCADYVVQDGVTTFTIGDDSWTERPAVSEPAPSPSP